MRQGPWMDNDSRKGHVWTILIFNEWEMITISIRWKMDIEHEWPIKAFPMNGQ